MKPFQIKSKIPTLLLFLAVAFYFAGAFLIPKQDVDSLSYANQEEYDYDDDEGEEHTSVSLIRIDGIGKVYTYKDIYCMSVPMFVLAMVFGVAVFNRKDTDTSLRCIILANCVLGVLLIRLTTKDFIWPTVFLWLGIVTAWIVTIIPND